MTKNQIFIQSMTKHFSTYHFNDRISVVLSGLAYYLYYFNGENHNAFLCSVPVGFEGKLLEIFNMIDFLNESL